MTFTAFRGLGFAVAAAVVCSSAVPRRMPKTVTVSIDNFTFAPPSSGESRRYRHRTNRMNSHTVVSAGSSVEDMDTDGASRYLRHRGRLQVLLLAAIRT